MGAWGAKAFENDSALDWLAEFEVHGLVMLRETLSRVADLDVDDYLDIDDGAASIAAAEVVAAALARRRDRIPEEASAWLDAHHDSLNGDDQRLARRAVERVVADESELSELWGEGEPESAWHVNVRELLGLLGGRDSAAEPIGRKPGADAAPKRGTFEREKQTLLTFLQARGLHLTTQQAARIQASQDAAEVRRWLARVVDAQSVAEMLDD